MRKILFLSLLAISYVSYGQQDTTNFKPTRGDVLVELGSSLNFRDGQVFLLNDGPINNMVQSMSDSGMTSSYPTLKIRRFIKKNVAERYLLNIAMFNDKYGSSTTFETGFSIGYGREKHFTGTRKLSTYLGWEIAAGIGSIKEGKETLGGFIAGAKAMTGADYYIVQKVYVGAELGLSVNGYTYGSNPAISSVKVSASAFPILRIGYIL